MHLLMILSALTVAYWIRSQSTQIQGNWHERWQKTLFLFLFPPLLILTTDIALLCMGPQGKMGGLQTGCFGYVVALSKLAVEGWQSIKSTRNCIPTYIAGQQVRVLNTRALFAGQIGFWQPHLVLSEGLLQTLTSEQLETVFAHEQGHFHYRDTFWFFWLGWARFCTAWLPNTDALWQELLTLRELRADMYAASRVDALLLAESLLLVASSPSVSSEVCCAALGSSSAERLEQRIEALLEEPQPIPQSNLQLWKSFLLAFLPMITIIFHT
jgi:Zn-dependent protease with chaperone function